MAYITKSILKQIYKPRPEWSHKGDFGRLLAVSGSEGLTGSPTFVSIAAYKAGCDLVFTAAPERAALITAVRFPEIMAFPLAGKFLTTRHIPQIMKLIDNFHPDACVIGPALWREGQTLTAILQLIKKIELPMVLDADAIRALAINPKIIKGKRVVLTPHAQEFHGLMSNLTIAKGNRASALAFATTEMKQRTKAAEACARNLGCVVVLKGHIDVITDGKRTALNKKGPASVYMTKGGMGDTLAGVCGAYLARGADLFTAACAATYVNGRAGELAAANLGEGTMPTDLLFMIPRAIHA